MSHFLTVRQTAERFPAFSESSIRYWIFHADTNGLGAAIHRIGKKILINESAFMSWIESQKGGAQ